MKKLWSDKDHNVVLEDYTLSLYTVYNKTGYTLKGNNMQWFGCRNVNVVSATSEFYVGVYSLRLVRTKEQLFNAYIVETPECIPYSYHGVLIWNLQKTKKLKKKTDLYNLKCKDGLLF